MRISTSAGRHGDGRVIAVLGPTNTGKTHYAVERMLGHQTGMIGLPLRLLAREVYDKVVALKGASRVALLTGEEKILPDRPAYYIATVESMPVSEPVEFLAVDEIQLAADWQRGHVFTERLLHARGSEETVFMGSATARPLLRHLLRNVVFLERQRFSQLKHVRPQKLSRLPRRAALVAFSAEEVYALAELVRRTRGGTAVVMGALSPRTRNAQVALYQNGDVDYLVATDAIGMGLNMDIDHVAFAATRKFDGRTVRGLDPSEIGQIAGRAGRHMNDGSFSTIAGSDAASLDPSVIAMVEEHRYRPLKALMWRNSALEFGSLKRLIDALEAPSGEERLIRMRAASDLDALKALATEPGIARFANNPEAVRRVWEVCQIPDFRRISEVDHLSLLRRIILALFSAEGVLANDWIGREVARLDISEGDIDTLAARIANIRTWTYIANRRDWLHDAAHWAQVTRAVEDKLSDALHDRLTQRFVDRRTSILMRQLRQRGELSVSIEETNEIIVEGQPIGVLEGFSFRPDPSAVGEEWKTLSAAADAALKSEIFRRARIFANIGYKTLKLDVSDGFHRPRLVWQGAPVAVLAKGANPYEPRIALVPDSMLGDSAAEAVLEKCQEWFRARCDEKLEPLVKLKAELDLPSGSEHPDAPLKGLARGVAFRLYENFGILGRSAVAEDMKQIDQAARRGLRRFHIRIGSTALYMPLVLKPHAVELRLMLWALHNDITDLPAMPTPGLVWIRTGPKAPREFYEIAGFRLIGEHEAIRLDMLERLADAVRPLGQDRAKDGFTVTPEIMGLVGCSGDSFTRAMRAIGYGHEVVQVPVKASEPGEQPAAGAGDAVAEPAGDADAAADGEAISGQASAVDVAAVVDVEAAVLPPPDEASIAPVSVAEPAPVSEAEPAPDLVDEIRFRWAPAAARPRRPAGERGRPRRRKPEGQPQQDGAKSKDAVAEAPDNKPRQRTADGGRRQQTHSAPRAPKREQQRGPQRINEDSPFAKLKALKEALERKP